MLYIAQAPKPKPHPKPPTPTSLHTLSLPFTTTTGANVLLSGCTGLGLVLPFHYAPCASDLIDLGEFTGGQFNLGGRSRPSSS